MGSGGARADLRADQGRSGARTRVFTLQDAKLTKWQTAGYPVSRIARLAGASRAAIYRRLAELGNKNSAARRAGRLANQAGRPRRMLTVLAPATEAKEQRCPKSERGRTHADSLPAQDEYPEAVRQFAADMGRSRLPGHTDL